ncbi:MAG: SAF domain-containing protein [Thermoactinomyces sp.]
MQDAKRRAILFLVIALMLSLLAGILFMQKVSAIDARLGNFVTVYVAKDGIKAREKLSPDDFEVVEVPKQYVQKSAVTDLNMIEYEGRQYKISDLVSLVSLQEGETLTANMLKPQMELSSVDKRMVMIYRTDTVGFDDVFNYGDRVDIVYVDRNGNGHIYKYQGIPVVSLAKKDQTVTGLGLEMTLEQAADFVSLQNTAASIRILKAPNVGSNMDAVQ